MPKERETFYPASRREWRKWLKEHHQSKQSIWIICYKQSAGVPTISWSDVVDEALCFGWIDSTRVSIGDGKFVQFITRRKPKSNWSKINKDKVARLIEEGKMTKAGYDSIDIAKKNGSWKALDKVETLTIPKDLATELRSRPGSRKYFMSLSKSVRKMMLQWVAMAKRPETKEKRILEIAEAAAKSERPKQFS
ncbi:MAG: hypothetical protein EOO05_07510 [Chitinophagaceae bacterium]|nr:MAG: hypothetical protein EOO05_07510 [Chitinophagaceae bacterium]